MLYLMHLYKCTSPPICLPYSARTPSSRACGDHYAKSVSVYLDRTAPGTKNRGQGRTRCEGIACVGAICLTCTIRQHPLCSSTTTARRSRQI